MNLKKSICLLLALTMCFALFAACGKTETPEQDGQNPVMNFIGHYINDRLSATIEAVDKDGAKISAYWGDTARDGFQWDLTGTFDEATMRINYSDAVKKSVTYTDVDTFEVNEVLFENGKGYIQINEDGTLTWNDEQDPDMSFEPLEFVAATDDDASEPASEDASEPAEESTVPANLAGDYSAGRCNITIETPKDNEVKIFVHWGSSANEATQWTMSGIYDPDTMRVNYSDSVKTNLVFDENGEQTEANVEYENGFGRIQFYEDGTFAWQDEQEIENVRDLIFAKG